MHKRTSRLGELHLPPTHAQLLEHSRKHLAVVPAGGVAHHVALSIGVRDLQRLARGGEPLPLRATYQHVVHRAHGVAVGSAPERVWSSDRVDFQANRQRAA
jgi:hypothetical protein